MFLHFWDVTKPGFLYAQAMEKQGQGAALSDAAALVLEYIRRAKAEGVTARDLRAQTGFSLDDFTLAVTSLRSHGYIQCIIETSSYRCLAQEY